MDPEGIKEIALIVEYLTVYCSTAKNTVGIAIIIDPGIVRVASDLDNSSIGDLVFTSKSLVYSFTVPSYV